MFSTSELFGKRLKEIRESKNIKQVEFAGIINIEPTNLSKIEKGIHLPKEENIKKIAEALNVDVTDLFDFKHIQPREKLLININKILNLASDKDIRFIYKIINAYIESK